MKFWELGTSKYLNNSKEVSEEDLETEISFLSCTRNRTFQPLRKLGTMSSAQKVENMVHKKTHTRLSTHSRGDIRELATVVKCDFQDCEECT